MLNAANKMAAAAATILFLLAAGCSSPKEDWSGAQNLLDRATAALESGDYIRARELVDSIDSEWPKAVDVRKKALGLRPRIIEGATMQELTDLMAEQQYLAQYVDSLGKEFDHVAASKDVLEPYSVHKSVPKNWREMNTAIARVNADGSFVVISSLAGNTAHHTALRLTDARGASVTSGTVPYDSELKLSRESVRFPSAQADTLGVFALAATAPVTLEFVGGNKAPSARLSAKETGALASTYRLSKALLAAQANARRIGQLEVKLQTARDQSARVSANE